MTTRTTRTTDPAARARRRAFTLIETMLALVLAAIVVSSAIGVMTLVVNAHAAHGGGISRTVRLAQAQGFFRDTFVRLVAGVPLAPPPDEQADGDEEPAGEDDQQQDADDEQTRSPIESTLDQLARGGTGGRGGIISQLLAENDEPLGVMFEVYLDTSAPGWPTPVMECVVTDPPSLGRESAFAPETTVLDELGFVRSEIRLVPQRDGLYTLMYVPLDPIGEPVPILRDLQWASFHALPSRDENEWVDVHAAYLQEDFPAAVRVVLFTDDGREIDWLFEVQSIVPEGAN